MTDSQPRLSFEFFPPKTPEGKEKLIKPDPAIFNLLIKRYALNPAQTIFIDDNIKNVTTAKEVGLDAIHFTDPQILRMQLNERGIIL